MTPQGHSGLIMLGSAGHAKLRSSSKTHARAPRLLISWMLAGALCCIAFTGNANSQRFIDYGYDAAGNLIHIESQVQSQPPIIESVEPALISPGLTQAFTVTGSNFLGAQVLVSNSDLALSGVTTTINEVRFFLTASLDAATGSTPITLMTTLGQANAVIEVAPRAPRLSSVPSPIVVAANATPTPFAIHFDAPDSANRTLSVSTGNEAVASVTPTSVTLPAGERVLTVEVTGFTPGKTSLNFSNARYLAPLSLTLAVAASFSGEGESQSRPVGVYLPPADGSGRIAANTTFAKVGVRVGGAEVFPTARVGVVVGDVGFGFQALPVGVEVGGSGSAELVSQPPFTGVIVGPLLLGTTPASVSRGSDTDLLVTGVNLGLVDNVTLSSPDDVVIGVLSVNDEGTVLTVPLSVGPEAAVGVREINVAIGASQIRVRERAVLTVEIE